MCRKSKLFNSLARPGKWWPTKRRTDFKCKSSLIYVMPTNPDPKKWGIQAGQQRWCEPTYFNDERSWRWGLEGSGGGYASLASSPSEAVVAAGFVDEAFPAVAEQRVAAVDSENVCAIREGPRKPWFVTTLTKTQTFISQRDGKYYIVSRG